MALALESEVFGSLRAAASVERLKATGSAGSCEKGQWTFPACRKAVDAVQVVFFLMNTLTVHKHKHTRSELSYNSHITFSFPFKLKHTWSYVLFFPGITLY